MSKRKVSANEKHLEKLNLKLAQRNNKLELEMQELKKDTFQEYQRMLVAEKNVVIYEKYMKEVLGISEPLIHVRKEISTRRALSRFLDSGWTNANDGEEPYSPITDEDMAEVSKRINSNGPVSDTIRQINTIFGMLGS